MFLVWCKCYNDRHLRSAGKCNGRNRIACDLTREIEETIFSLGQRQAMDSSVCNACTSEPQVSISRPRVQFARKCADSSPNASLVSRRSADSTKNETSTHTDRGGEKKRENRTPQVSHVDEARLFCCRRNDKSNAYRSRGRLTNNSRSFMLDVCRLSELERWRTCQLNNRRTKLFVKS